MTARDDLVAAVAAVNRMAEAMADPLRVDGARVRGAEAMRPDIEPAGMSAGREFVDSLAEYKQLLDPFDVLEMFVGLADELADIKHLLEDLRNLVSSLVVSAPVPAVLVDQPRDAPLPAGSGVVGGPVPSTPACGGTGHPDSDWADEFVRKFGK